MESTTCRDSDCVFCLIAAGQAPATIVRRWAGAIAIRPRRPITEGHVLVLPLVHVADAGDDAAVSALTMMAAAELAGEQPACNIITSRGADATQTVFHLHIHVVPRRPGDGLTLPWSKRWTCRTALTRLKWSNDRLLRLRGARPARPRRTHLSDLRVRRH